MFFKLADDFLDESFQNLLVGNITHKMVSILFIDDTDLCTDFLKLLSDAPSNTLCPTSHNDYFIFKISHINHLTGYEHLIAEFPEVQSVKDDEKRHGDIVSSLLDD